jgi:hypothetical protein
MLVPFFVEPKRKEWWLFAAILLALAVGHFFYWSTDHVGVGARYWFAAVPGLLIMSAAGVSDIARAGPRQGAVPRIVMTLVLAGLIGWNMAFYLPQELSQLHNLNGITADLKNEVKKADLKDAVVFVQTWGIFNNDGFYMNDPFLRGPVIFARDLGDRNTELLAQYSDYEGYMWDKNKLKRLNSPASEESTKEGEAVE